MFGKFDLITLYQSYSWSNRFVFTGEDPKTKIKWWV